MEDDKQSFPDIKLGLSALRDGSVAIVAVLYIFGFATWSFRSWMLNLGRIEAFDPQYFVAGIPALLLLIITLIALVVAYSFAPSWAEWLRYRKKRTRVIWGSFWLLLPLLLGFAYFARYIRPSLNTAVM